MMRGSSRISSKGLAASIDDSYTQIGENRIYSERMSSPRLFHLLFLLWGLCAGVVSAEDAALSAFGLEATEESLASYFQTLRPGSPELDKMEAEFEGLGAATYAERHQAYVKLRERPFVPRVRVLEAVRDDDPEVRMWSERLREETADRNRRVLMQVLATISNRDQPVHGLTAELLHLTANLPSSRFVHQTRQALLATAQTNDLNIILADLDARPAPYQLNLLEYLLAEDAVPHVAPYLDGAINSKEPNRKEPNRKKTNSKELNLCAAHILLKHGQREPLAMLASMVDEEGKLLPSASGLLALATGKYFADAAGWQTWVDEHGATAELNVLDGAPDVVHHRLLVAIWDSGEVLEFDADGNELWKFEAKNATSVQGLPNGNRLLVGHNDREVREFDAVGEQVWSAKLPDDPVFVQRLPNGNTHVALERAMLLFDPTGKELRKVAFEHRAWFCARRLPDGNTLVTFIDPKGVTELDPDGKTIWQLKTEKRLRDATRLANGNTLVVEMKGRVLEYSPDKKRVWESPPGLDPVNAVRLPSGNTRVVTGEGMIELTPTGQRIDMLQLKLHKTPNGASYF